MHGQATQLRLYDADPKAVRIADLSDEYLRADAARRDEIGAEIAGLISGRVVPLRLVNDPGV